MKVSVRLFLMSLSGVVALLIILAAVILDARPVRHALEEITNNSIPSITRINAMAGDFANVRRLILFHLLEPDATKKANLEKSIATESSHFEEGLAAYQQLIISPEDQGNLDQLKKDWAAYKNDYPKILALSDANDNAGALAAAVGIRVEADAVTGSMNKIIEYNDKAASNMREEAFDALESMVTIAVVMVLVVSVLLILVGQLISRSVTNPLNRMKDTVERVATQFDFTSRVEDKGSDEVAQTLQAFNRLLETLQQSIKQLHQVGHNVGTTVSVISTSSEELATTANHVSSATSSMAAGVEEVTVSISHVADRSEQASHTARSAGQLASNGGEVIQTTIGRINQIANLVHSAAGQIESLKNRTNDINIVVGVIKDIADQTNLLALNAAIEAARAGEQGRGFAVVADEVRKLAERTGQSTKEITANIQSIQNEAAQTVSAMQQTVEQVNQGVSEAESASQAIQQIRQEADNVVEQVSEISSAMREQSTASSSMAQQVERVAQMTEHVSTTAAATAKAGNELRELREQLHNAIDRYKV